MHGKFIYGMQTSNIDFEYFKKNPSSVIDKFLQNTYSYEVIFSKPLHLTKQRGTKMTYPPSPRT